MKFTTPCFVRVEDMDKRKELTEWLKGIGYHVCSCSLFDGWNTLHCRGIDRLKIAYEVHGICDYDEETRYNIGQFKAENAENRNPSYDCGENVELFKALAAMNDENDMQQLFICDTYADIGCVMWHLCENKKFKHYYVEWEDGETDIRNEFRKATVEEIIKHFKKS